MFIEIDILWNFNEVKIECLNMLLIILRSIVISLNCKYWWNNYSLLPHGKLALGGVMRDTVKSFLITEDTESCTIFQWINWESTFEGAPFLSEDCVILNSPMWLCQRAWSQNLLLISVWTPFTHLKNFNTLDIAIWFIFKIAFIIYCWKEGCVANK